MVSLLLSVAATTASAQRRHVVVDTDAGPDDLMAIAFLLGRDDVRVDAITTVSGLASPQAGARNVLRLLSLVGADHVPVYIGASAPLQAAPSFPRAWIDASEKLGAEAAPPTSRTPDAKPARAYLAEVLAGPRGADILALGPLTNVALALRDAKSRGIQRRRVVMMGGALDVPGNLVTPEFRTSNTRAEWNIFADPRAAREVFASRQRLEMVGLDATRHVRIDTCLVRFLQSGARTARRRYVERILDASRQWIERGDYYAWDPLAAAVVVDSRVVTFASPRMVVEVDGPYPGWTRRNSHGSSVRVAVHADRARFVRMFDQALGGGDRRAPGCLLPPEAPPRAGRARRVGATPSRFPGEQTGILTGEWP